MIRLQQIYLCVLILLWTVDSDGQFVTTTRPSSLSSTTPDLGEQIVLKPSNLVINHTLSCRGAFFCRSPVEPYSKAKIRLLSNIRYIDEKPRVRHIVDGTETDEDGSFLVEGEDRDHTLPFEPVIVIYHQCGQSSRKKETYRRFAIKVPSIFINSNETFDMGRLNLALEYPGERDGTKYVQFTKPMRITGELFCTSQPNAVRIVRLFSAWEQTSENFIVEQTVDYTSFAVDSGRAKLEEPILQISHQCDMSVDDISKGHYRQFLIKVPFYYYNVGRVGLRDFNVGKLGLQLIYPGESINKLEDL